MGGIRRREPPMKAAVLTKFGEPLSVRDVPDPVLGTGEVLVDVVAAPLGPIDPADAGRWVVAMTVCLVPYGGFLAVDLQPGETVLVSGATGNFGSSAVAVALAMGAARVVAPGRDEKMLAELENRFG